MKFFLTLQPEEQINCPNCHRAIDAAIEADLSLVFEKGINKKFKETLELEYCDRCKSVMLPVEELDSLLMFDDFEPNQVSHFLINKQAVQAFLSANGPENTVHNIPWEEYRQLIKLEQQRKRQAMPNTAAVQKLNQDPKLEWYLSVQAVQYVRASPFKEAQIGYAMLIVDDTTLVEYETKVGEFAQAEIMAVIYRACALPADSGLPKRPKTILVGNPELFELLAKPLKQLGIEIKQVDPNADNLLRKDFNEFMGRPEEALFFEHATDQQIKAFEKAARSFFALQPWKFTTPDDCLAFRFANGSWQYATIMGHFGESFGMTMYQSWLGFCRVLYNASGPIPRAFGEELSIDDIAANFMDVSGNLKRQGGMESFNASEKIEIPAPSMHRLLKLGVKPVFQDRFAFAQRFDEIGEFVLPRLGIGEYTSLLEALVVGINSQKAKKTFKLDGRFAGVDILYPSSGLENAPQGRYKLEFEIKKFRALKRNLKVVIYADATERFSKIAREVMRAVKTKIKEGIYIMGFHDGNSFFWKRPSTPRLDPSPMVFQCLGIQNFAIDYNAVNAKISISPEPDSDSQGLEVLVS